MSDKWVTVGKIGRPYGVKGGLHIQASKHAQSYLKKIPAWRLVLPEHDAIDVTLSNIRPHGVEGTVAFFDGLTDRGEAAKLTHANILVERSALPVLEDGAFYWTDLIGLTVKNQSGEIIGQLQDCLDNGAQTVLVILNANNQTHQIPFVWDDTVLDVSLDEQCITVDWVTLDNEAS